MTLNERILDFLDGSLPAEDEAELLHTLSVSPEKRDVLRDFMEQRSLFARDSKTLSVPYAAEQRLWARIDGVTAAEIAIEPPVLVPVESSIVGNAPSAGFFAHALHGTSAFVSAITLFAGIGIGYFAGSIAHDAAHTATVPKQIAESHSPAANNRYALPATATMGRTLLGNHRIVHSALPVPILAELPTLPVITNALPLTTDDFLAMQNLSDESYGSHQPSSVSPDLASQDPAISQIPARSAPPIALADIGGDGGGIKPMFHHIHTTHATEASFLSRFEFRVDESFGRQFPSNTATNVSLPLITNTSFSTFFQVLPHSNVLWAGAGYGTANITRKNLYTQTGNPIDPSQQVLAADTSHAQTSYIAAMAELRLPAFAATDLTFDGGYGFASLGQMLFGEVGLHYDITEEVGAQFGLRVLRFSYDLSGEKASAIQSGSGGLAISNAVASAGPSFNTELNAGLFFHF
ncbi:MAG TPA: hypothetical protein VFD13_00395 [Candidatus Kapabacteria bacterium]|nr:hypothetical protein [Candidatus Kapabacteria bacterium]